MTDIFPCQNLPNWDWKKGDPFPDNTTMIEFNRNYFDCGIYYFDGTFNVVKFSKGMTLYHGSGVLANAVVTFPVGINFYKPYDMAGGGNIPINPPNNSPEFLAMAATGDESIEEIVAQSIPITAGWYADPSVARLYSGQTTDQRLRSVCGERCVNAYKLKKDLVFYLLDDDYNIAKLFASDPGVVPEEKKRELAQMFSITNRTPQRTSSANPFTRIRYQKDRISNRAWDLPFAEWACRVVVTRQGYAGYAATVQYTQAHGGRFHLEFIFCNAFKYLSRDFDNILDWQHNPRNYSDTVRLFMEQLSLYQSVNVNFHAGDLLQHSIWTLLFAEKIIETRIIPPPVDDENFRRLTAFVAFIHDIGKMTPEMTTANEKRKKFIYFSIKPHPEIGAEYILGQKPLNIYNSDLQPIGALNIDDLFRAFGIDDMSNKEAVANVIKFHWDFGEMLRNFNADKTKADYYTDLYIQKILSVYDPGDSLKRKAFFYILLVVSIADIKASQPYGVDRLTNTTGNIQLNKSSHFYPFVTNMPKQYRGGNVAEVSGINSTGVDLAKMILNKL